MGDEHIACDLSNMLQEAKVELFILEKKSKMSKVCRVNVYGGVDTIGSKSSKIKIPRPMSFLTKLNEFECYQASFVLV